MFLAFTSDNGGTIRAVWNDCYGAATMDGTPTGRDCGDKVLAALIKGSWGFVMGGLGYGAVSIQRQADPNQAIYELQNQLPPHLEHGVEALKKRSADKACPNHNGMFNSFYEFGSILGHISAPNCLGTQLVVNQFVNSVMLHKVASATRYTEQPGIVEHLGYIFTQLRMTLRRT